jgi:GntR family transcriptional repressor for pyruvate dehydrogenase complex
MTFETIKKSALAEEITSRVLELIKEKELKPGDKLPPERELAEMMSVSRPSLREALRALAIMNVIEIRQGDGTYVGSLEPQSLVAHLDFVLSLDDSTFIQLFEARKILEVGIAGLAAKTISDEELIDLQECLDRFAEHTDDPQQLLEADLELHQLIAEAARNPILIRVMASISQLGLASRSRTIAIPGVVEQTIKDHREIVRALEKRDQAAAEQAMLAHLENVESRLD